MRDHSAKSESKTTDGQASQLHDIQTNNVIVFNPRAISMEVRNFLRRQRWRFRPLKRWVLPARSMKRAALESIGTFFWTNYPAPRAINLGLRQHTHGN